MNPPEPDQFLCNFSHGGSSKRKKSRAVFLPQESHALYRLLQAFPALQVYHATRESCIAFEQLNSGLDGTLAYQVWRVNDNNFEAVL